MKKFLFVVAVLLLVWIGYRWRTVVREEPIVTETTLPEIVIGESRVSGTASGTETSTESENIRVTSPEANATLRSPLLVSGEARVFEGTVIIRVKNTSGDVLIQEVATAHAPDIGEFGPFSMNVAYQFQNTKEGFVEVLSQSAKDGSDENLVRIPVQFE